MSIKLDVRAVDSALYKLRQQPDNAGARAELFEQLRPILHAHAAPCALTPASVVRIVQAAEDLLGLQLAAVIADWYRRPKGNESRLLRRMKRCMEHAVVDLPPDPAARIVEDDLKLAPLQRVRRHGRERVLMGILASTLARARLHFYRPGGVRFLKLAERCIYALVVHGRRPAWNTRSTRTWGSDVCEVAGVYSLCQQWAREELANNIHEVVK